MIIIAKIRKKMLESVKLKESVTCERIGCHAQHFERYLKGMPLKVVREYDKIALIEDSTGEQFTVDRSDLDSSTELSHDGKNNTRPTEH